MATELRFVQIRFKNQVQLQLLQLNGKCAELVYLGIKKWSGNEVG